MSQEVRFPLSFLGLTKSVYREFTSTDFVFYGRQEGSLGGEAVASSGPPGFTGTTSETDSESLDVHLCNPK